MTDIKNTVDATPFFAAVGATDLAVEKVREARIRAEKVRVELSADLAPAKVQARATTLVDGVKEIPAVVLNETMVVGGKVAEGYDELAVRGKNLVNRIRNQKSTKDLFAQAETSVAQAKGAVTSARNAAADIERSAKATITTTRKEAVKLAEVVTGSVTEGLETVEAEVTESAKRTRTAAKRTSTTTKNASKKAVSSAKAATTSARKTAVAAEKATEKAAEKVGDVPAAKRTPAKRTVKVSTKPAAKRTSAPAAKPAAKTADTPAASATVTVTA
jgi:heparin binding hemagglutinin HbhA